MTPDRVALVALVSFVGGIGLTLGERRWRGVDRAKEILRTGEFHRLFDEVGSKSWDTTRQPSWLTPFTRTLRRLTS